MFEKKTYITVIVNKVVDANNDTGIMTAIKEEIREWVRSTCSEAMRVHVGGR